MTFARLWGKIHGTHKDYYILEGFAPLEEGAPAEEDAEARGTGVNEFVYWATNSACGPWTQLPDLRPVDITSARNMLSAFTGNLDSKINTNPFYSEKEAVYLRA